MNERFQSCAKRPGQIGLPSKYRFDGVCASGSSLRVTSLRTWSKAAFSAAR